MEAAEDRLPAICNTLNSTHIFFRRPRDDVAFDHSLQADVISYEPPRLVSEMGNKCKILNWGFNFN